MRRILHDIEPDEIFLDATNLPAHEYERPEGAVERPVSRQAIFGLGIFFVLVIGAFFTRAAALQIRQGAEFASASLSNSLDSSILFATRGVIYDSRGKELAWNELRAADASTTPEFAERRYSALPGLSHVLGWVRYPKRDTSGVWWRDTYTPMAGIEYTLESTLGGDNGRTMVEKDARGRVQRENIVVPAHNGTDIHLAIDAELQSRLFSILSAHADENRFIGVPIQPLSHSSFTISSCQNTNHLLYHRDTPLALEGVFFY